MDGTLYVSALLRFTSDDSNKSTNSWDFMGEMALVYLIHGLHQPSDP